MSTRRNNVIMTSKRHRDVLTCPLEMGEGGPIFFFFFFVGGELFDMYMLVRQERWNTHTRST